MKLKSEYGNIVKTTNNKREIEYLKTLGYTEVIENKEKPKEAKSTKSKRKVKNNNEEN